MSRMDGVGVDPRAKEETGVDKVIYLERYTPGARQLMQLAQRAADEQQHDKTTILHVLASALALEPIRELLRNAGGDPEAARTALDKELAELPKSTSPSALSAEAVALLRRAEENAGDANVTLLDILRQTIFAAPNASVADLDHNGLGSEERSATDRVVIAGHLDRLGPR